ncbi:hypothetical protein D4R86_06105 [bacterium]|nr:MAG: hypothetical protein D4R86_06105 [bacterium]
MQRPDFVNDQIYHIYNRGVEKRNVFLSDEDRFRFVHDLFEFNDTKPALHIYTGHQLGEVGLPQVNLNKQKQTKNPKVRKPRKLLVEILVFCLMPNHYHLLLMQKRENGITQFMRKLGTGYTNYFNQKYERVGSLFQGKFKAVLIKKESQLLWIVHYIHLNPIELYEKNWKERKIKNIDIALDNLYKYRWSSLFDYTGRRNFPSVTQREFLLDIFGGEKSYKKEISDCLTNFNIDNLNDLKIE